MVPAAPSRRTDAGSAIAGAVPHALGYAQDLTVPGHARGMVIAADKTTIPGGRSRPGLTRRAYRNFRAYPARRTGLAPGFSVTVPTRLKIAEAVGRKP